LAPAQTIFPSFEAATESERLRRNELSVVKGAINLPSIAARTIVARLQRSRSPDHMADSFDAGA
jgi:hypothetical protein